MACGLCKFDQAKIKIHWPQIYVLIISFCCFHMLLILGDKLVAIQLVTMIGVNPGAGQVMVECRQDTTLVRTRGAFQYKDHLSRYRISIVKIRWLWNHLISSRGIPILVIQHLYIEQALEMMISAGEWSYLLVAVSCNSTSIHISFIFF